MYLAAPCAYGADARQTFVVTGFDSLRIEAPVEVVVVTGKGLSASATGDRRLLDTLSLTVNGSTLTIRAQRIPAGAAMTPVGTARIALSTGQIRAALVLGAGKLTLDRMNGSEVRLAVRGSGSANVGKVDADTLIGDLTGAGSLTLAGTAIATRYSIAGSGRADAAGLRTTRLRLTAQGSGEVAFGSADEATLIASGSGKIAVARAGRCTVRRLGNATISCDGKVF